VEREVFETERATSRTVLGRSSHIRRSVSGVYEGYGERIRGRRRSGERRRTR
jgi:hypothetical protein